MKILQQGDVVLKSIDSLPIGDREILPHGILAEGEVTGHSHRIVFEGARAMVIPDDKSLSTIEQNPILLFRINGILYVEAPKKFRVTHEEHKEIEVPAGKYQVHIVREYDHFAEEARNVQD